MAREIMKRHVRTVPRAKLGGMEHVSINQADGYVDADAQLDLAHGCVIVVDVAADVVADVAVDGGLGGAADAAANAEANDAEQAEEAADAEDAADEEEIAEVEAADAKEAGNG